MKTVFNNFVLYFNFLLLGLATAVVIKLALLGSSGHEILTEFTDLIFPSIALSIAYFRLAYPYRWRQLVAGFSGAK
ncbi:hypothetical protein FUA23_20795 [Neolewinella aurantiaca]|uniref:Uncharacterized protein n=1 Tax=Neolewinella aurantiaca TaxID=2602767 RepID=A0A5C7F584_9BACT|nr:hypothetical protein [Neolewinella aurantiaca]TXF85243.1 hypothetical protein FUA23_20795 [Neolewinella aurantiaca]